MRTLSTQDLVGNSPSGADPRGPDLRHVENWIFDLDNTLYPPGSEILRVAEGRIRRFIQDRFGLDPDEAHRLQKACLHEDGSTLAGLIRRFRIDPEPYLAFVNDVDVTTLPYSGFPTDVQAQMMALMALTPGISIITERIFESRFGHVAELGRLGADIAIEGPSAIVKGGKRLSGAPVMASDLRASAALVLAGLAAKGSTQVNRIYHLDRGYEKIDAKLKQLGGRISRIQE